LAHPVIAPEKSGPVLLKFQVKAGGSLF